MLVRCYVEPGTVSGSPQVKGGAYTCGCYGDMSNILQLQCSAPPSPPRLWIKEINRECITLSWPMAQEYGHIKVTVSGTFII